MRKEILFAIAAGAIFGLVIAFGIWRVNTSDKSTAVSDVKEGQEEVLGIEDSVGITIAKPEQNQVLTTNAVLVTGITKPSTWVVLTTEEEDYFLQSDEKGEFEKEVDLIGGINEILAFSFDENGNSENDSLLVIYSSEFIENGKTDEEEKEEDADNEATDSSDTVREKVKEEVNKAQMVARAYMGTITDISENTIQITKFVIDKEKDNSGEIQQISFGEETSFVDTKEESEEISVSDVAIGDFVVAMGYKNGNNVLEASRILITETIEPSGRTAFVSTVTEVDTNSLTVTINPDGDEVTIKPMKSIIVTANIDNALTEIDFDEIEEAEEIIVVGYKDKDTAEARTIHMISEKVTGSPDEEEEE